MSNAAELDTVRRAYAKQICAAAGINDRRIEEAFATIPREGFLGDGPWPILRWGAGYVPTPTADPVYLYTNVLVGILPERRLNNGEPSLHAMLIASAGPRLGEHLVHVGAGTGYYTAILAQLVGPSGRVTAIELDGELASRAAANLSPWGHISVVQGDGASVPFDPAGVIYVNAGVTRPAAAWLDGLLDGGRLILPLTAKKMIGPEVRGLRDIEMHGAVFRIERRGDDYFARWISPVAVYPCEGGRDDASEAALAGAFKNGRWREVTRLYRTDAVSEDRCWLRGQGWCLAFE